MRWHDVGELFFFAPKKRTHCYELKIFTAKNPKYLELIEFISSFQQWKYKFHR